MNPNFNSLNHLLVGMNNIAQTQNHTSKLWAPPIQMQIGSKTMQTPIRHPSTYGPTLMQNVMYNQNNAPPPLHQSLFFQNYINPADAQRNHQVGLNNMSPQVEARAARCHVFPPLLIRFHDPSRNVDQYVPVEILRTGELRLTDGVPDVILNFHADTRAITMTLCDMNPKKIPDIETFISVVYSLMEVDDSQTVDVEKFTLLYDQARYNYLKNTIPLAVETTKK